MRCQCPVCLRLNFAELTYETRVNLADKLEVKPDDYLIFIEFSRHLHLACLQDLDYIRKLFEFHRVALYEEIYQ